MEERTGAGAAAGGASAGGPGEQAGFDPQSAAAIVAEAAAHAERELTVRRQPIYLIWGLVYLVVYGAIWLSVRGQRPYQGPSGPVLGVVVAAVAIGAMVTAGVVQRSAGGVGGTSAGQRRIYLLAVVAGYIGVLTMEAAIDHAGASRAVIGSFGAAARGGGRDHCRLGNLSEPGRPRPRRLARRGRGGQRVRGRARRLGRRRAGRRAAAAGAGVLAPGGAIRERRRTRPGHP